MPRLMISTEQFTRMDWLVRGLVRQLRRLAAASVAGVALIALLLRRDDGFDALDAVVTLVLLAPAVVVLVFAQGVLELISLPDRLRRVPGEGQERLSELARVAGGARTARLRDAPLLIWRLRSSIGSVRDVAGIALPLRVLTPPALGLAALAAFACVLLACAGVIALVVLAVA